MGKCEECDMRCAHIVGLPGSPIAANIADHLGQLDDCPRYDAWQEWRKRTGSKGHAIRFVRWPDITSGLKKGQP